LNGEHGLLEHFSNYYEYEIRYNNKDKRKREFYIFTKIKDYEEYQKPKAEKIQKRDTKNSLILLHNHPSTGTFSAKDLRTFCNNDSLYIMTVVGNDGSVYVLVKDVGFDPSGVLIEYGKLAEQYKAQGKKYNATMAVKYILKNAEKYNMKYKKGRKKI
jgi:hypothetical protein